MPRRPLLLALVAGAAATAAAIPLIGLAAPSIGLPDLRSDEVERAELARSGDRLLLRFDGFVTNAGNGPLDVTGNPSVSGGMKQRIYQGGGTWSDAATPLVRYETADGHNHFHLMNAMRYSLWTSDRRAEVAPAQKVGFCLYDLQRAGGAPVNDDGVYSPSAFCEVGNPGASYLSMGVSAGWRDIYDRNLALQWVDASATPPGAYQIAAESDPQNRVIEANEGNNGRVYSPFTIPGHIARAVEAAVPGGRASQVTLAADTIGAAGTRAFRIESAPARGSLGVAVGGTVAGDRVTYTPAAGFTGTDSFTYSAITTTGVTAGFPRDPARATATLRVGGAAAVAVGVSGAPARMVAGTAARLSATVSGAGPGVTWSASAGAVAADGLFTAPAAVPAGGIVTVRATSTEVPGSSGAATIAIDPVPPVKPAVGNLPSRGAKGALGSPWLTRGGRTIVLRTVPAANGTLRVAAMRGGDVLARCRVRARTGVRATCLLRLPRRVEDLPVKLVVGLKGPGGVRAGTRLIARP